MTSSSDLYLRHVARRPTRHDGRIAVGALSRDIPSVAKVSGIHASLVRFPRAPYLVRQFTRRRTERYPSTRVVARFSLLYPASPFLPALKDYLHSVDGMREPYATTDDVLCLDLFCRYRQDGYVMARRPRYAEPCQTVVWVRNVTGACDRSNASCLGRRTEAESSEIPLADADDSDDVESKRLRRG